ncbi:MAG: ATP-binding protein [Candidatus Kapaibacterium sp.]
MAWSQLIAHERIKKILQKAALEKRVPHAYLFWGMGGTGKEGMALEFAKALNCHNPFKTDETFEACGECPSCKKASALGHENIQLIFPLPAAKKINNEADPVSSLADEQIELIREQMALKADNSYHKINIPNANQIRIQPIRHAKKNLTLSPGSRGRRFLIIFNAELMTNEASNAFLKTLEEPHENITIILITSRIEMLLPTIVSRCQQIMFGPLPQEQLAERLKERYSLNDSDAGVLAALSNGSFTAAVEAMDEDMKQLRLDIIDMLRTSLKKTAFRSKLLKQIEQLTADKDKVKIEKSLQILLFWIMDVIRGSTKSDYSGIVNLDQKDSIVNFASHFGDSDMQRAVSLIEDSINRIRRNVNLQLILVSLFLQLRNIFMVKKP